jgi:uncharacterized protein YkwD
MKHSTRSITRQGITRQGINDPVGESIGGFYPPGVSLSRSQVPPGNAVRVGCCLRRRREAAAHRSALPGRSLVTRRSQAREGYDPSVNSSTGSFISGRVGLFGRKLISGRVGFFPLYFLVVTLLTSCDSVVSAAKDILVTPETPVASVPPPKNTSKPANNSRFAALEQAIHQKINQYRQSQNLPPLTFDARISEEARGHSQAMASGKATFSHDGFEKRVDAIAKSIPYRSAGENLAYNQGYRDPVDQAVEGWLNSPGHYKNIVGDFDVTGVGVVKTPQGRYYFTQIFIRRAKYGIF